MLTQIERAASPGQPPTTTLDFRLHDGCCFRSARALLVYQAHGAVITDSKKESTKRILKEETLRQLAAGEAAQPGSGSAFFPSEIDVHFPPLDLSGAYLSPTAFPNGVFSSKDYEDLKEVGLVAPHVLTRRADKTGGPLLLTGYNADLKSGALSIAGRAPDPLTGCITFSIPSLACALLEGYLRNPANTVPDQKGRHSLLVLKRDVEGVPTLTINGYEGFLNTAVEHSPLAQIMRTRVASNAEEKVALLSLPGFQVMLTMISAKLGWPLPFLNRPHHVHVLLQDEEMQAVFDWHTDGEGTRVGHTKERNLLGLSVQLTCSAATAMWVHGFQPVIYAGQGSCVLFHGGCLHRSLPWAQSVFSRTPRCNVIKVVLLYKDVRC